MGLAPDDFPEGIEIDDHRTALDAAAGGAGVALAREWLVGPVLLRSVVVVRHVQVGGDEEAPGRPGERGRRPRLTPFFRAP